MLGKVVWRAAHESQACADGTPPGKAGGWWRVEAPPRPQGYVASALDISLTGAAGLLPSSTFLARVGSTTLCSEGSRYKATGRKEGGTQHHQREQWGSHPSRSVTDSRVTPSSGNEQHNLNRGTKSIYALFQLKNFTKLLTLVFTAKGIRNIKKQKQRQQ